MQSSYAPTARAAVARGALRAAAAVLAALCVGNAMAIEEAPFTTVERDGAFELREYRPYVVAQTLVESDFATAGNEGFRRLFGYISGKNAGSRSISMTAPVEQARAGDAIAMTAPVEQSQAGQERTWRIAFVLPASFTLDTAPHPADPRVSLAQMPARLMAAVRYSGTWSRANYEQNLARLQAFMARRGLTAEGDPVWARHDPPLMPWFLRRNEILIEVKRPQPPG